MLEYSCTNGVKLFYTCITSKDGKRHFHPEKNLEMVNGTSVPQKHEKKRKDRVSTVEGAMLKALVRHAKKRTE